MGEHLKLQRRSTVAMPQATPASPFANRPFPIAPRAGRSPVQRTITLSKENVYFENAENASLNLSKHPDFSGISSAATLATARYLDSLNTKYVNYKNLVADAKAKALRAQVVFTWSKGEIQSFGPKAVESLTDFDFYQMSAEQLAALTPPQHQQLSSSQIDALNLQLAAKGQPEVKGKVSVTAATAETGSDQEKTGVYAGGAFYHEKQTQGWCGKHALNAFLGKGYFSRKDLYNLALKMVGGEKSKAESHITWEGAEDKIGDISIPFLKWILMDVLEIPIAHFRLSDLSENELSDLLANPKELIMTGAQKTKFPGETVHKSGHYAAAKKDKNGKWWVINSTAAEQVQVDPAEYSKALEIIVAVDPKVYAQQASKAALLAQNVSKMSFEEWQDEKNRNKISSAIAALHSWSDLYKKFTRKDLVSESVLAKLDDALGKATSLSLEFDENFNAKSTLDATVEDFKLLATLVMEVPEF